MDQTDRQSLPMTDRQSSITNYQSSIINHQSFVFNHSPGRFAKPEVQAVGAYHLKAYITPIKLNQNENPFGFPADLKAEVWRRVSHMDWERYPEFYLSEIRQRLAEHAGVPEDCILVGNGSNELLQMTLLTVVGRGDHVIVPVPTFTLYKLQASVMGATVHTPLLPAENNFDLPVDAIIDTARTYNAKVIVVCTPNNPTGTAYNEAKIRQVIEGVDGLVLLDEAYREFNRQDYSHLLREYDNVIIFRTFSKALAMAGLRVGYCLARPEMVAEISKVRLPYALNILSETATLVALEHPEPFRRSIETTLTERARVMEALSQMPGVHPYPSAANFILTKFDQGAETVFDYLLGDGILVRDVSHYPGLKGHVRLSIGTPAENEALLTSLGRLIN